MICPRCGNGVRSEHDEYGGTEFLCYSGHSWTETPGIPITDDPNFSNKVREGKMSRPRMVQGTAEEQERSYQMRQAQQRIQNQRNRLKRQGIA